MDIVERAPLTIEQEQTIVALLARGDSYSEIKKHMLANGRSVNKNTISVVKKRNMSSLTIIKEKQLTKALNDAQAIKNKANTQLSQRLDASAKAEEAISKATKDYMSGLIDHDEFTRVVKSAKTATIQDLVSVSREMHNQSLEEPKEEEKRDMQALIDAIKSGNEVTLNQMIFNKDAHDLNNPS